MSVRVHRHTIQVVVRLSACKFILLAKQSHVLSLACVGVGDTCAMASLQSSGREQLSGVVVLGAEFRIWQPAPLPPELPCRSLSVFVQETERLLLHAIGYSQSLFSNSGKHSHAKLPRPALSLTSFCLTLSDNWNHKDSFPEAGPSQLGSLRLCNVCRSLRRFTFRAITTHSCTTPL